MAMRRRPGMVDTSRRQAEAIVQPGALPGRVGQRESVRALAAAGRGGDTMIGHLTPGELVVPRGILAAPGVREAIQGWYANAGLDMDRFVVGGKGDSINPRTGMREFRVDGHAGAGHGGTADYGGPDGTDGGEGDDDTFSGDFEADPAVTGGIAASQADAQAAENESVAEGGDGGFSLDDVNKFLDKKVTDAVMSKLEQFAPLADIATRVNEALLDAGFRTAPEFQDPTQETGHQDDWGGFHAARGERDAERGGPANIYTRDRPGATGAPDAEPEPEPGEPDDPLAALNLPDPWMPTPPPGVTVDWIDRVNADIEAARAAGAA